jgi:PAS domain S-box-containing protein
MQSIATELSAREATSQAAKRLFHEHQQVIYKRTDRLFAGLMVLQWVAAITIALVLSPRTWEGASSQIHPHVWAAILLGGMITILPVILGLTRPGATSTRYVMAIAQMLIGSLLIHLTGGRIETHFHVFGSLAFLAFYRDWRVLVPATLIVVVDHLFRGLFWPESVYGVLAASIWRTLEHGVWVVFEDIVLIIACLDSQRDMWSRATQNAGLDASERRFRSLISAISQVVWTADAEGRVDDMPQWRALTGQSVAEVKGSGWLDALHPDDRERTSEIWREAIRTGSSFDTEYRIRKVDGSYGYYSVRAVPVVEADGAIQEWVGICGDITARKQAEDALQQAHDELEIRVNERTIELSQANAILKEQMAVRKLNEEELRFQKTLLECQKEVSIDGILVVSTDRRVISFNQRLCEILGTPKEVFASSEEGFALRSVLEKLLNPEEFRERVEYLHEHQDEHSNEEILLLDGRTIDGYSAPVKSPEGIYYGRVWYLRDITARKQIEADLYEARDAALESARLKSEFLANMSHEIRTPMNGIIGMTDLLLDTGLDDEQLDFAETIRTSGDALLTIINDILDFSKIDAGHLQFEMIDFDLSNAVEGAVESLAERAWDKKLELACLIHKDVPTDLRGDPGRLRQVLINLIGNTVKFTDDGEVIVRVVRVEVEDATGTDAVLRFSVADTGIGVSEVAQPSLFQAFTQADGSMTRKYGGTGLGLAISKQLVELMGGQIGFTSEPGKGSTFWFTGRFQRQAEAVVPAPPTVVRLNKLRALIVDDNATNRKILAHQLDSWGMVHEEVASGEEALRLLRRAAAQGAGYDLAILDLMMPVMDGFELSRAIKADADIAGVKLVLLTSFGQRGHGSTAREIGVAAYLNKPVRQSQLFDCLTAVMSRVAAEATDTATELPKLVTKHTLKASARLRHERILLAEDHLVNQKVALRQLAKLGYQADVVANGRAALEALERVPYDLVLMDCQMPEMDGYETTAAIRMREGDTKHTWIVAMTAHALDTDRAKCLAAGMDDYLSKPVKPEELARVLKRTLSAADKGMNAGIPAQSDSPVDLERMYLAMGDEPEELFDMLSVYLDQMAQSFKKLDAAIASGNAGEVNLIAHNCAGANANCGITALIQPLRELERLSSENNRQRRNSFPGTSGI